MTHERDIERILDRWFDDGPTQVPDRVLVAVADRIDRQLQRPAWRLPKESHVNGYLKPVLAVAAVFVIAVIGYNLLPDDSVGGPRSTPSPSPTATIAPSPSGSPTGTRKPIACDDPAFGCAGALTAGGHMSAAFKPALTFEVPAGWANTLDRERAYVFGTPGNLFSFGLFSQVAIPQQDAECKALRKVGAGNAVEDWVAFITTHPGLIAETPVPVSVGGYQGVSVSFARADSWTATCPDSVGPAIMVMTDSGTPPDRRSFVDDQQETWTIIDVDGETVIIKLDSAPSPAAHARDRETVQPIIDSMSFSPGG